MAETGKNWTGIHRNEISSFKLYALEGDSMSRIRLMTYNVHHCTGMDGRQSPHRIAEVIAASKPDIVALQELDVGRLRTRWVDQPRLISKILEMQFHFFATVRLAPGDYGTAILSRWPLRPKRTAHLPVLHDRR